MLHAYMLMILVSDFMVNSRPTIFSKIFLCMHSKYVATLHIPTKLVNTPT